MTTGTSMDLATDITRTPAPKSAAAQELNTLGLIMRHVAKLSTSGKSWLVDRLMAELDSDRPVPRRPAEPRLNPSGE